MVFSKKTMMMSGISLAAVAALVVLAGVGSKNQMAAVEAATSTSYTLTLDKNNGLTSSQNNASETYTWDTTTNGTYHTSWSGTGVNYSDGNFLHIAMNGGEFHNTITLHQITNVKASGKGTNSTDTVTLSLFTSKDGATWSSSAIVLANGVGQDLAASDNIGFVKFEYTHSTIENYITSVVLSYNCISE